jgi:endo-1,4-beta-xylanase
MKRKPLIITTWMKLFFGTCLSLVFILFTFSENAIAGKKSSDEKINQDQIKGLKYYYRDFFPIGVAVSPLSLSGADSELILKHFISITAENAMKMAPIHPEENRYFWDNADKIVNFAQANGLIIRGHVLCWHQQVPAWMFRDKQGKQVTKEILLARLKDHITQVVTRYKGKIYAWDVVNEAIDDDSSKFWRENEWFRICGEEYIVKAFEYAHAADPDAKLFYNDYNTENPVKRDKIYRMLKQLIDAGIPIHGIGLQGHWSVYGPSEKDLRDAIEKYSSLGIKIQITELDISIYKPEADRRELKPGESTSFTPELEQKQMAQYKMTFRVLRDYKNIITGVTFWNVSDKRSWLDNFPVRGRKNYPLLFDQDLKPKKAFWEVVKW